MEPIRQVLQEYLNQRIPAKERRWWLSCVRFTIGVTTDENNLIVDVAPIAKKFQGQHIKKLADYMRSIGGFLWHEYKEKTGKE